MVLELFNSIAYKWILKYCICNNVTYISGLLTTQTSALVLNLDILYISAENTDPNLDLLKFWWKINMLIWKSQVRVNAGLGDFQKQISLVLSPTWQLCRLAYNSRLTSH